MEHTPTILTIDSSFRLLSLSLQVSAAAAAATADLIKRKA